MRLAEKPLKKSIVRGHSGSQSDLHESTRIKKQILLECAGRTLVENTNSKKEIRDDSRGSA